MTDESWWAYCTSPDLDYWEGRFAASDDAIAHALSCDFDEFWVARCAEDPEGDDGAVLMGATNAETAATQSGNGGNGNGGRG